MIGIPNEPVPVNSSIEINYPIEDVKKCIEELLRTYPQHFIANKNGVSHELGTYVFSRPKGIETPTLRVTVSEIERLKTKIVINCSSSSFLVTPPDLQLAITEVHNILMANLKGCSKEELTRIIKQNDKGNDAWGCLKSIGCLGFFGIPLLFCLFVLGLAFIMFILALI